ncbi:hypothetical protein BUALT_Bualt10G0131600 [Buddleja alternifolia]|uniref:Subtilisin-like protease n=1 Tax=Buddleja alternifolia TaxID=168488 RepID=A0AAV6WZS8_9LAMI|nr:hypothetical protein BUALT_Bualt10G0131600 [Buddleja alternifolia]
MQQALCRPGTLSPTLVRGKAIFCWRGATFQALEVQRAGGIAAVLGNVVDGIGVSVSSYLIPATVVLTNETMSIFNYTQTAQTPLVTLIPPRTLIGTRPAPFIAPFTSRAPNFIEPNILKPDITAPGLNILAAWSEASSPLNVPNDRRVVKYQIISGTSMSCPHVAAVAALLKAIHPDWSSAAIRSALMTTAKQMNNLGEPITDALGNSSTPFEYGAGHIQPSRAADPGLVYDASYNDYLLFLCSSSGNLLDPSFNCPEVVPSSSDFNYPSLAIANLEGISTVTRTVTNVGIGNSSYSVTIDAPPGYSVQISPATLYFSKQGEQHCFSIIVEAENSARRNVFAFGWCLPDITAPGLNILAPLSEAASPTKLFVVKYNILSSTSMSCPHVAAAHPDWSGAAIRSALMTTATQTNNMGLPITDGTRNTAATPFH